MLRFDGSGAVACGNRTRVRTRHLTSPFFVAMMGMVTVALGGGCDFSSFTDPPIATRCTEIAARCQLADGPIGVCQERPCRAGEPPPCFACTAQH